MLKYKGDGMTDSRNDKWKQIFQYKNFCIHLIWPFSIRIDKIYYDGWHHCIDIGFIGFYWSD